MFCDRYRYEVVCSMLGVDMLFVCSVSGVDMMLYVLCQVWI